MNRPINKSENSVPVDPATCILLLNTIQRFQERLKSLEERISIQKLKLKDQEEISVKLYGMNLIFLLNSLIPTLHDILIIVLFREVEQVIPSQNMSKA